MQYTTADRSADARVRAKDLVAAARMLTATIANLRVHMFDDSTPEQLRAASIAGNCARIVITRAEETARQLEHLIDLMAADEDVEADGDARYDVADEEVQDQ